MPAVQFDPPEQMNLVGYILRSLLERNLATEAGAKAFSKMKGRVLVGASAMRLTLDFSGPDLVISVGERGKPDARVSGDMTTLLGVALGKGMVGPVLSGKLKVGGKFWRLLRMIQLLKAEATP
jgi:hypothetical protein